MSEEMNYVAEALAQRFEGADVLSFEGRGGRTFDYIEDETVMDRADAVLGLGASSWSFTVITDTCVRGSLDVSWPGGATSHYEDFGYATRNDSAEPLKEAVSDAIRRLGRYIGIARYLYHKHDSTQSSGRGVTSSSPRPPARPTVVRSSTEMPEMPPNEWDVEPAPRLPLIKDYRDAMGRTPPIVDDSDVPQHDFAPIGSGRAAMPGDECPDHPGVEWRGEPGDLYHGPKPYHRHPDNIRKARGA